MLPAGGASRPLVGAWRLFPRSLDRHFTTSSPLLRSKKHHKQSKASGDEDGNRGSDARKKIARALSGSSRKSGNFADHSNFSQMVETALQDYRRHLVDTSSLPPTWDRFERRIKNACRVNDKSATQRIGSLTLIKKSLHNAFLKAGAQGLRDEIQYMVYSEDLTSKYSAPNLEAQEKLADFRYPAEWYPRARAIQRTIHLHVGPTNSGKTYHALKRLEASKNGFYAGPLRLLAQEVYHRFNDMGVPVSLVTGDEIKSPENGKLAHVVSNTVEMVAMGREFEVGVIDEIQMIADPKRGWAWTRAVLGAVAHELHLCGEVRAVPLIRELCALTGDKLEIHRYERLNGLEVSPKSLRSNINNLQKGDCLVSFSRFGIHTFKQEIEKATGRRAAIVYGGLPAEIRSQQAKLFNDPDNDYDFLVASDAIGMGLNLSIKRIVFETLIKRTKQGLQRLSVSEIKQIGGRAGRYRAAGSIENAKNVGIVTSWEEVDLPYIKEAMGTEPPPLRAAGIWPTTGLIQKLSAYFPPGTPFEYVIKRLLELAKTSPLFFICDGENTLSNAEIIDSVAQLKIQDQLTIIGAPMSSDIRDVCCSYADCVAENDQGKLLEIPGLNLEVLQQTASANRAYMQDLEVLHKSLILYCWLSYRFGGAFTDRTLATHVKKITEQRMMRALTEFSANKSLRKNAALLREIALQKQLLREKQARGESGIEETAETESEEEAKLSEIDWPDDTEEIEPESPLDGLERLESNTNDQESAPVPQSSTQAG